MKPVRLTTLRLLCAALPVAAAALPAHALGVTDAANDYVAGYIGSKRGDLDVIGAFVTYNPSTDRFVFSSTSNADIGLTPQGFFVWGVNRGGGTAGFAANGLPNILFDSLVIFNPDGSGRVTTLGAGGSTTNFAAGTAHAVGSTLVGQIDGSLLPSVGGRAKADYTWNLWPRDGALAAGFGQISDFAPDAVNAPVTVLAPVPEPASVALLVAGLAVVGAAARRRGGAGK